MWLILGFVGAPAVDEDDIDELSEPLVLNDFMEEYYGNLSANYASAQGKNDSGMFYYPWYVYDMGML